MSVLARFLLFSLIASGGYGQEPSSEHLKKVLIGKLVIESNTLSSVDRERLVRSFERKAYVEDEIGTRIRQALTNRGYFKATVDEPRITFAAQGQAADVRVKVDEERQYRLGEIRFEKATVFPDATLRNLFQLQSGDVFNRSRITRGLEDTRELYWTRGYVNLVPVPEVVSNESRGTIDLVIHLDEGIPYDFGKLYLEGIEPYPGAAQELRKSWESLQGKRFNSVELRRWFTENKSHWKVAQFWRSVNYAPRDPEHHVLNVTLSQWDP
jgi:outer membrane protein assembly factor BamA